LRTRGFQLDFIAERDIGSLDLHRLALTINLNGDTEEELQPTIPYVVWA